MIKIVEDSKGVVIMVKSAPVVSFQDMLDGLNFLKTNEELPREIRIVEDAIGSQADFTILELQTLTEKLDEVSERYRKIKHAVVHDDPLNTAFALIIQRRKLSSNYQLNVFSTLEQAYKWIDFDGSN